MRQGGQIQVVEWQDTGRAPRPSQKNKLSDSWYYSVVWGALGSTLIHLLLFETLILGSHVPKIRNPDAQGAGASNVNPQGNPSESLVLLSLIDVPASLDDLMEEISSRGVALFNQPITLVSPDPLPALKFTTDAEKADASAESVIDAGDPAGRAAMFGRYVGQITARIERIWRRPRSPISQDRASPNAGSAAIAVNTEKLFSCQVRISQNTQGDLEEILLLKCNGSYDWQRSLIVAIQQSAPLAAPPIPSVFSKALTLKFESAPFDPHSSLDEYELESPEIAKWPVQGVPAMGSSSNLPPSPDLSLEGEPISEQLDAR